MDHERRSSANGNEPLLFDNSGCGGRPPPGLVGNFSFPKQGSSPPPGLGPTPLYPGFQPSNNNIFLQSQSIHPFYQASQPMTGGYYDSNVVGTGDTVGTLEYGNTTGNQYSTHQHQQQSQHAKSEVFGKPIRQFPLDGTLGGGDSLERPRTASGGVIEPIIENIMGSMGNSGGTYSHFGPNPSIVSGLSFAQGHHENTINLARQNPISSSTPSAPEEPALVNTDPFNSSPEWEFQRKMESRIRQKLLQKQQQQSSVPFGENKGSNISGKTPVVHQNSGATLNPHQKYDNCVPSVRPDTPVKPSYLEMLTKNCSKETHSAKQDYAKGDATASVFQVHNQGHRKSLEGFVGSTSSPPASNPSTASSSPITKPRAQQKGKENLNGSGNSSSSSGSSKSSRKNTPMATPVHQFEAVKNAKMNGSCWITKLSGRVGKCSEKLVSSGGKVSSHFDFEVEDLDVPNFINEGHAHELSCQNNLEDKIGSGSSKKKAKRKFSTNGNAGADPNLQSCNASGPDRRVSGSEKGASIIASGSIYTGRRGNISKEKSEKLRGRKEGRNCAIRRLRSYSEQWIAHLMKALTWLWMLLANVTVLSASLTFKLMEDSLIWWKTTAIPIFRKQLRMVKHKTNSAWKRLMNLRRKEKEPVSSPKPGTYDEFLSVLGPDRNILLPSTGDDALSRLLSVRGQDPYSILGVKSNSSEETIRRYYKKQAVLVHPDKNLTPGAEEAFKILAKAFEMVGEPEHRLQYHQQLLEAHAKERFIGEFGELFEELRKKMETACSTIRCTKCKGRHKKNKTSRPVFAARYCAQCRIHHAGREGELWAEKGGMLSFTWQFYACMGNQVWEINEWGRCQRSSLKHLKPNAHSVIYRLVSSGQSTGKGRNCSATSNSSSPPPPEDDLLDPEMEDWDSLFNNLYRNSGNATNNFPNATSQKGPSKANTAGAGSTSFQGNGANSSVPGKKRKGKKK